MHNNPSDWRQLKMDETFLNDNIVMDEYGNLWLVIDEGEVLDNLNFEFDVNTGNCYIDETITDWDSDYYIKDSSGNWIYVGGSESEANDV